MFNKTLVEDLPSIDNQKKATEMGGQRLKGKMVPEEIGEGRQGLNYTRSSKPLEQQKAIIEFERAMGSHYKILSKRIK